MMTEVYGSTSRSTMELLKVIRVIISVNFYLCGNYETILYFTMRQNILIDLKRCGAISQRRTY